MARGNELTFLDSKEVWRVIEEFPNYLISSFGRVTNNVNDTIKDQTLNQQGIPSVLFMKDRVQYRRSVAVLVANEFLTLPPHPHFDTPINLDGDRTNNAVTNLAWRPRWFAIKYHKQFHPPYPRGFTEPIQDVESGEVFDTSWDAAMKFGLIDADLAISMMNGTWVFPTHQYFVLVD